MIRIFEMGKLPDEEIFARQNPVSDVSDIVKDIIATVRKDGDTALKAYSEKFDHVELSDFLVTEEEKEAALKKVEPEFLSILKEAAANIRAFHEKQVRQSFIMADKPGVILGQRVLPLERVGLYVPGGTAAYPSTVLMDSIPAKIAGVKEIVMVTPPSKEGSVNHYILAAAHIAGVGRIFKVGGAQAVAALAYGTESIPRVDKIVGPGNAFVAEAKKQVFGQVGIDMIAGPSEVLVLADGKSDPSYVAADLLSQAEHDKNASAVLITDSMTLAQAVQAELEKQIPKLRRADIARTSIDHNGKIIVAKDLHEGVDAANRIAPEHMEVCVDQPFDILGEIRNAGSVFLGRYNAEPTGDYFAGPNHTLPTSGTARFYSPLGVDDFVKRLQYSYYTKDALERDYEKISFFAKKEGLTAHARAVDIRFGKEDRD
ncbi:MAG: histidinol dehydrogenase [Oribacterium sp.]|jgi:histidinol dehydrogenase|nr:histidinol dehydrogenase [Oribacterium sp.]MDY6316964.1 histidinol dehydrogenase [Oribacterium sp.]